MNAVTAVTVVAGHGSVRVPGTGLPGHVGTATVHARVRDTGLPGHAGTAGPAGPASTVDHHAAGGPVTVDRVPADTDAPRVRPLHVLGGHPGQRLLLRERQDRGEGGVDLIDTGERTGEGLLGTVHLTDPTLDDEKHAATSPDDAALHVEGGGETRRSAGKDDVRPAGDGVEDDGVDGHRADPERPGRPGVDPRPRAVGDEPGDRVSPARRGGVARSLGEERRHRRERRPGDHLDVCGVGPGLPPTRRAQVPGRPFRRGELRRDRDADRWALRVPAQLLRGRPHHGVRPAEEEAGRGDVRHRVEGVVEADVHATGVVDDDARVLDRRLRAHDRERRRHPRDEGGEQNADEHRPALRTQRFPRRPAVAEDECPLAHPDEKRVPGDLQRGCTHGVPPRRAPSRRGGVTGCRLSRHPVRPARCPRTAHTTATRLQHRRSTS